MIKRDKASVPSQAKKIIQQVHKQIKKAQKETGNEMDKINKVAKFIHEYVKKNPVKTVAISVGIGVAIGMTISFLTGEKNMRLKSKRDKK